MFKKRRIGSSYNASVSLTKIECKVLTCLVVNDGLNQCNECDWVSKIAWLQSESMFCQGMCRGIYARWISLAWLCRVISLPRSMWWNSINTLHWNSVDAVGTCIHVLLHLSTGHTRMTSVCHRRQWRQSLIIVKATICFFAITMTLLLFALSFLGNVSCCFIAHQ